MGLGVYASVATTVEVIVVETTEGAGVEVTRTCTVVVCVLVTRTTIGEAGRVVMVVRVTVLDLVVE